MDDALRARARALSAGGTLAEQAAWLRERLRAGEVTQARLELAAFAGHRAAGLASGHHSCDDEGVCFRCAPSPRLLHQVKPRGGHEAELRAALAGARFALASWDQVEAEGGPDALAETLWRTGRSRAGAQLPIPWPTLRPRLVWLLRGVAAHVVRGDPVPIAPAFPPRVWDLSPFWLLRDASAEQVLTEDDWNQYRWLRPPERLMAAIGEELARWALGLGEPLQDLPGEVPTP